MIAGIGDFSGDRAGRLRSVDNQRLVHISIKDEDGAYRGVRESGYNPNAGENG